jgi:hypothetical protein
VTVSKLWRRRLGLKVGFAGGVISPRDTEGESPVTATPTNCACFARVVEEDGGADQRVPERCETESHATRATRLTRCPHMSALGIKVAARRGGLGGTPGTKSAQARFSLFFLFPFIYFFPFFSLILRSI